jgi:hypothetical protein
MTEPELSTRLTVRALSYIGRHPLAPLLAAWHNSLRLLELEGSYAWRASAYAMGLDRGVAEIGVYSFWLLAALALAGAATGATRRAPGALWAVPALLWLVTVLVNAETPRFREPIDPLLIILAGCGLVSAATPESEPRSGRPPVRRQRRAPVP